MTWKTINLLTSKCRNSKTIKSIFINNIECFDNPTIANFFNQYFSKIALELESQMPTSDIDPINYVPIIRNSFFLSPVCVDETKLIIKNLKNTRNGINSLPVKLFKIYLDVFAPIVTEIANISFTTGKFPEILKSASVTPIHKKDDKRFTSNYRPIVNLHFMSKILEKLIYARVVGFFDRYCILSRYQFGFRKLKSTEDAIILFLDYVYDAIDAGEHCIAVFVDFMKAFDTVHHGILLAKLQCYGIRGVPLELFRSYLLNRRHVTRIGNVCSDERILNIGVPQGSVLGPLLFLVYINDLHRVCPEMSIVLYADDTTIVYHDESYSNLIERCNGGLVMFRQWAISNRLSLNVSKTCYMVFTNRNHLVSNQDILYGTSVLARVDNFKFLGIILDERLRFDKHIKLICDKSSKCIGMVYRLREVVPRKVLLMLYNALFFPYISYCNLIWGFTYQCHLNPLILLQKRLIRLICNESFLAHTNPLFLDKRILKIPDVIEYRLLTYVFKNMDTLYSANFHSYNTRRVLDLRPNFHRTVMTQRSINYVGPTHWNRLPVELKCIQRLSSFKYHVRNYFLTGYND